MAESAASSARLPLAWPGQPVVFLLVLWGLGLGAAVWNFSAHVPVAQWPGVTGAAEGQAPQQIILAYSLAPRLVVSLLAGAALGLSGALLQQVLRNPIASPTTLGIESGAGLALSVAMIWLPGALAFGREWVALGGGALSVAVVVLLSWRSRFSPLVVVLSGMVTSLFCAALAALLTLLNTHYLSGLFLWGAGALSQNGWAGVSFLAPRIALAGLAALLLVRALTLLGLDDASARSLGLSLMAARLAALGVAIALAAFVVATVGSIGFIGLAAPVLARLFGARRVGTRLLVASLAGAGLLLLTDQCVQLISGAFADTLPTGAVTAMLGAPLLLWMIPRLKLPPAVTTGLIRASGWRLAHPVVVLVALAGLLAGAVLFSCMAGPGLEGWSFGWTADAASFWPLRLPRALAALAGGALLAVSGCILQRMTGNPLASPEVLGVSAGAACGLALLLLLATGFGTLEQTVAASGGAFVALLVILFLGRSSQGSPERVILVGIAVGALLDALVSILMASGDPRAILLFNWMTGSTYGMQMQPALFSLCAALVLMALLPLIARWLDILPLGAGAAQALGLSPRLSGTLLLVMCAVATAIATLLVGPLSFVGLFAPHLARLLGFRRPLPELYGAALLGALVMVGADFAGRALAFPWQLPAGLLAAMIGAPAFLWLLSRKQAGS